MDIQDENQNKVQFTFYDSKGDQALQNENINSIWYFSRESSN